MTAIACLTAIGDAHARGLAHGRAFRREIADNIETYLRRFAASGLARDQAMGEAHRWLAAVRKLNPAYAEEMRGIAEGCGESEASCSMPATSSPSSCSARRRPDRSCSPPGRTGAPRSASCPK